MSLQTWSAEEGVRLLYFPSFGERSHEKVGPPRKCKTSTVTRDLKNYGGTLGLFVNVTNKWSNTYFTLTFIEFDLESTVVRGSWLYS